MSNVSTNTEFRANTEQQLLPLLHENIEHDLSRTPGMEGPGSRPDHIVALHFLA